MKWIARFLEGMRRETSGLFTDQTARPIFKSKDEDGLNRIAEAHNAEVESLERRNSELTDCGVNREVEATCGKCIACLRESGRRNFNTATKLSQALGDEKAQVLELTARIAELEKVEADVAGIKLWSGDVRAMLGLKIGDSVIMAIQALQEQLAEARKDSAWRPIETAPKDGTRVLICSGSVIETGNYRERIIPSGWYADSASKPRYPSVWMPLPATPLHEKEGQI